jgi:anaerobic ribonucleoside-triphosphate reductase
VNLAGFREAVEAITEKSINSEEGLAFALETIQALWAFKQKLGRKYGRRLYLVMLGNTEAAGRLAELDIDRFGVAKVKFSGTREKPFYSTIRRFQIKVVGDTLALATEQLQTAQKAKLLTGGGGLDVVELGEEGCEAEALMDLTRRLVETQTLEFFTYNHIISYCDNCNKSWLGTLHKCPSCGSMSTLTTFDRFMSM